MIIYSCITNAYDVISDDHYYDPDTRYVMFHDGTVEQKGPWEMVDLREYYTNECPVKMALYPKILPNRFFDFGEDTVWVDACYTLTKNSVEVAKDCFPFTRLRHASRFTYYDEMLEGYLCEFFSYDDAIDATKYYHSLGYDFKQYGNILCAAIWRTINEETIKFCEDWWRHYKDTNVRDQIAFDVSLQLNNINPKVIEDRNDCGIPMGAQNKSNRKKKRKKYGSSGQQVNRSMLLGEMRKYVGMHPFFYAKANHDYMMGFNL